MCAGCCYEHVLTSVNKNNSLDRGKHAFSSGRSASSSLKHSAHRKLKSSLRCYCFAFVKPFFCVNSHC